MSHRHDCAASPRRGIAALTLVLAGCKASSPAPTAPEDKPAPAPIARASEPMPAAAKSLDAAVTEAAASALLDAQADANLDPACTEVTFCDVVRLMIRAEAGDEAAHTRLDARVTSHRCAYVSDHVRATSCGWRHETVMGTVTACSVELTGDVDEADLRRHVVPSAVVAAKSPKLATVAFGRLPTVPVEERAIQAAVHACLPDFRAPSTPDPWEIEPITQFQLRPYFWAPKLSSISFTRDVRGMTQSVDIAWETKNPEIAEACGDGCSDTLRWEYELMVNPPQAHDAGPPDAGAIEADAAR